MPRNHLDPYYLLRWDFSRNEAIDQDVVQASHRLGELPLASDQGLQEILDRIPPSARSIQATGSDPAYPSQWQPGRVGDLAPAAIMDAIERGRYRLTLASVDQHDVELQRIVGRLVQEIRECHVGLRTVQPSADLVISSPAAQHRFGCDPRPSVLWQIRGRARVSIYPNRTRFIDQADLQEIAQRQCHKSLYFEPAFERHARMCEVGPGELISWPHPMPYRIENTDGLNISLRLTFHTRRSLRQQHIHRVNRWLQSLMLDRLCSDRTDGAVALLRNSLAIFFPPGTNRAFADQQEPGFVLDRANQIGKRPSADSSSSAPIIAPIPSVMPSPDMVTEN